MKNKLLRLTLIAVCILGITGCGVKYPDLKDNSTRFYTGEYIDEYDDVYLTIEYNGRTYMPYGTLKGTIKSKNIKECIGYIIQKENNDQVVDENNKDTRVYTLIEDPSKNYLMIYYIGTKLMNQPDFWRAIDTKNKKIDTPNYIDSLEYNYWK